MANGRGFQYRQRTIEIAAAIAEPIGGEIETDK
jgi:hypothetical protein